MICMRHSLWTMALPLLGQLNSPIRAIHLLQRPGSANYSKFQGEGIRSGLLHGAQGAGFLSGTQREGSAPLSPAWVTAHQQEAPGAANGAWGHTGSQKRGEDTGGWPGQHLGPHLRPWAAAPWRALPFPSQAFRAAWPGTRADKASGRHKDCTQDADLWASPSVALQRPPCVQHLDFKALPGLSRDVVWDPSGRLPGQPATPSPFQGNPAWPGTRGPSRGGQWKPKAVSVSSGGARNTRERPATPRKTFVQSPGQLLLKFFKLFLR